MDITIDIGPGGAVALAAPQQQWTGDQPNIMQVARFAGHDMLAVQSDGQEPSAFELHYLGVVASGFETMGQATESAPAFAKEVFSYLAKMIKD